MKPQVVVVNFDHPLHTIPPAAQPPASMPTLYRLLSCDDRRVAAPILNNLVDAAHIGGRFRACSFLLCTLRHVCMGLRLCCAPL